MEIDLHKIQHNTHTLVRRLARRGIAVTAVTKAFLGCPQITEAILRGGVSTLGDSRIENIEVMRQSGMMAKMCLIRAPMLSQVARVVASADVSFNSELRVVAALDAAAEQAGRTHGVVLMVELGDLREGIMPRDVEASVAAVLRYPNIHLVGIGANLGCRSGIMPDDRNMGVLSALAEAIEETFGILLDVVTGGNSGNLSWALNASDVGRINDLRLGESVLLGSDPLSGDPIAGLHSDAIILFAEVIESKAKPSTPWGQVAKNPFGNVNPTRCPATISQAILAIGHQDVDPAGLRTNKAINILATSSDHLVIDVGGAALEVGSEVAFTLSYGALLRAMTSPFVQKLATRSSMCWKQPAELTGNC